MRALIWASLSSDRQLKLAWDRARGMFSVTRASSELWLPIELLLALGATLTLLPHWSG